MKVLVIGGGIAGLSLGRALKQSGIEFTLCEAAPSLRAAGAGIWMSPNAMKVLDHLGCAGDVIQNSYEMKGVEILDNRGRLLSRLPLGGIKERHGYSIYGITRQRLHEILSEGMNVSQGRRNSGELKSTPEILTSMAFESLEETKEGVIARFSNGAEIKAGLVVGADGLHSRVRSYVHPKAKVRYSGQVAWWGLCDYRLPPELLNRTIEIWMGRLRFGFMQVQPDQTYFFAVESALPGREYTQDWAVRLREIFAGAPQRVCEILESVSSENIIKTELCDLRPGGPLYRGRAVLIGDAGHATTPNMGQGAAQALESSALLARLLSRMPPAESISEYARLRKNRVKMITSRSYQLGQIAHTETSWLRYLLSAFMRLTPETLNRAAMDQVFTPSFP